ncbi:hypothetical protein HYH03_013116 [Edaphochlamys debaryana]|uniref:EF-hand domain-containing protein n=1 Tax=Edaphochlamys debaryana TaxID=47281 RepID=A0A835XRD3_9CHLO|nr:hypothetical protein HYH03_013116 [Edaphochlamys debaryana]|eukprot:KAG2488265.1 hypothetical protein HYH03_013116 [Edaphochlamys debaryana]
MSSSGADDGVTVEAVPQVQVSLEDTAPAGRTSRTSPARSHVGADRPSPAESRGRPSVPTALMRSSHLSLCRFARPTRKILQLYDANGDGRIDAGEIQEVVSTLVAETFKRRVLQMALVALLVFACLVLGSLFGLTYAVVGSLRDAKVVNDVLVTVRGHTSVQTAFLDFALAVARPGSGVGPPLLVPRSAALEAVPGPGPSAALRRGVAVARGNISAATPFERLAHMTGLLIYAPGGASYSLRVTGVSQAPAGGAGAGPGLVVHTAVGTLTLAGGAWSAAELRGPLLEELFPLVGAEGLAASGAQSTAGGGRRRVLLDGSAQWVATCAGAAACGDSSP